MSVDPSRPDLDMLADYVEGLLTDDERRAVERAVAEDPATAARLTELEALPGLLADITPEPMPADVAARIDAALAEEEPPAERSASVHRLPARRRWLAPALVAAAALGVIGIGAQVVSTGGGQESASDAGAAGAGEAFAEAHEQAGAAEEAPSAADPGVAAPTSGWSNRDWRRSGLARLTVDSFQRDLDAAFAPPLYTAQVDALREEAEQLSDGSLSILENQCAADLPPGPVLPVRLDGDPAVLVLRKIAGEPDKRLALAYPAQCPAGELGTGAGVATQPLASGTVELP